MAFEIKPDNSSFVWLHRFVDTLLPVVILYPLAIEFNIEWHDRYMATGLIGGLLFVLSAQMVGIYNSWRGRSIFSSFKMIIYAWLLTWASLIVIAFLVRDSENFSRTILSIWAIVVPLSMMLYRLILRILLANWRAHGKNSRRIAIVGAGKVGQNIAITINQNKWLGFKIAAFIDDNPELQGIEINNIPVIANTSAIANTINTNQFDEVYLCLPLRAEEKIKDILNQLTDTTAVVKFVPDLFSFDLMHSKWVDLKGIPIVSVFDTPLNSTYARLIKRIEDISLSMIILALISPIMIALAIGVKMTSPGPVFYRQTRVGWNGKNFHMLKFRSMPVNIEKDGVQWGSAKNKTNTRFGQFIRSTSLDELPQFLNVLLGDMSIVGPRPERDIFVEQFRKEIPRYMQKHMVKAGITGWAQINGWRGDTDLGKRIEFDLHYINNWSLWLDIKIIALTIFKGFINKNAC